MQFLTICAGGGLADIGIKAAGHHTAIAIEREQWIADTFALNFPNTGLICGDCTKIDYSLFQSANIDAIWASFPCQDASLARSKDLPAHKDKNAGLALIDAVNAINPRYIFLENVPQWQKSEVFSILRNFLYQQGYWVNESIINAADYGVPQSRKRLIVRACRDGVILSLPPKGKHKGWYHAIADLLPQLPITELANWQRQLVFDKYGELPVCGEFLIPRIGARKDSFRLINRNEPAPTLRALGHDRHYRQFDVFDGNCIKKLLPIAEARLQTMPDNYDFGNLDLWQQKRIIGNGVPCELVEKLLTGIN